MDTVQVIALGADVFVGGNIPAKVLSVTIGEGYVAYKCSWWKDGQHYTDWISQIEVTEKEQSKRQTIKFKHGLP